MRHLFEYVHGLGGRSRPPCQSRTRSGFAISGRPIVTPSQSPRSMAEATTEAVWNPPVQTTGTETASLIARQSSRLIPSIPFLLGRSHAHRKRRFNGHVRKMRKLRNVWRPLEIIVSYPRTTSSTGKPPAGLRGCGNEFPDETWNASTPASSSHLQTWTDSSSFVPFRCQKKRSFP